MFCRSPFVSRLRLSLLLTSLSHLPFACPNSFICHFASTRCGHGVFSTGRLFLSREKVANSVIGTFKKGKRGSCKPLPFRKTSFLGTQVPHGQPLVARNNYVQTTDACQSHSLPRLYKKRRRTANVGYVHLSCCCILKTESGFQNTMNSWKKK